MSKVKKFIVHPLEAFVAGTILLFFKLMPLDMASAVGGKIARLIGPLLGINRRAFQNLKKCFPELTEKNIQDIIKEMWENLGRVMAELPHLKKILNDKRITISGKEHLLNLRDDNRPGIFVSPHLANWEVTPLLFASVGLSVDIIYRAANNPLTDKLIQFCRSRVGAHTYFPKGRIASRGTISSLRQGRHLGILIDQKFNDGVSVPFFGRPAKTSLAPIELSKRFNAPLVPIQIERLKGARFKVTFYPPLKINSGEKPEVAMERLHKKVEAWIQKHPGQWLWLHRRWIS